MESSTVDTAALIEQVTAAVGDWVPAHLHRLSLDEYEAMVAASVFGDKGRLHLLNGCLVEKMTQKPPHSTADELCSQVLFEWFRRAGTREQPSRSAFHPIACRSPIDRLSGARSGITRTAIPGRLISGW